MLDNKKTSVDDPNFEIGDVCELLDKDEIFSADDDTPQSMFNGKTNDRFKIIITLPKILKNQTNKSYFSDDDRIIISALTIPTPNMAVPSIPISYLGRTVNITSTQHLPYDPVSITYRIDSKFINYSILFNWLNLLSDQKTGEYAGCEGDLDEYSTDIQIWALDEFDNDLVVAEWVYEKAFITELNGNEWSFVGGASKMIGSFSFAFTKVRFTTK